VIGLLLFLQGLNPAPDGPFPPQPQIAWACEMRGPDDKKFQVAGAITGGLVIDGEPAKLTPRLITVTTDTSNRLKGTARFPYIYASHNGGGFYSFSLPGKGDRYSLNLQLFPGHEPGVATMTWGYPRPKAALGAGYCISRIEQPQQRKPAR
jgi:hypothetical protein